MANFNYNTSQGVVQGMSTIGQGIGQGIQAAEAEARARAPIPPAWEAFLQRILKGEDPTAVGREAAAHPDVQRWTQMMRENLRPTQQGAFPRNTVPDVGAPGGQPQVMPPGAVNPAGAGQSLGAINQSQHLGATQSLGGYQPPSMAAPTPFTGTATQGRLAGVEGVPGQYNMAQMGQPAQGAPQVSPQQAGAQVLPPSRPKPAAPAGPAPERTTNRQFDQLMPILPTLIAAQGRGQAAQVNADSRVQSANLRATQAILLGVMKENGMADRFGELMQSIAEKYDVSQQQAVLSALVDEFKAKTGADATVRAAGVRADTKEDPAEKELRAAQSAISNIVSKPEWVKDSASQAEVARLTARIGELQRRVGREDLSTPGPIQGPKEQKGAPPAQKPAAPKPSPASKKAGKTADPNAGKVHIMRGGVEGWVSPQFVKPTDKRL